MYIVEDIDLTKYTKKEGEKDMKYPDTNSESMDWKKFNNFINKKQMELEDNIKNTETIVTKDG